MTYDEAKEYTWRAKKLGDMTREDLVVCAAWFIKREIDQEQAMNSLAIASFRGMAQKYERGTR